MTVTSLLKTEFLQNDEKHKMRQELKLNKIKCKWDKMRMKQDEKKSKTMTRTEIKQDETRWNTVRCIL